jgi:alkylhydroperoxidase family enzyme
MLSLEDSAAAAERAGVIAQFSGLNVFRVLLHQPELAKAVADLLLSLLAGKHLDARLRELIIMRLGWATRSEYEWTQHWPIALRIGLSEDEVLAVRDWRAATVLSEADRAVLEATDEVMAAGAISAETWERCAAVLDGPEALLELVGAIGCWRMIATLLRSLEVPLEAGITAWPPDGSPGAASD